MIANFLLEPLPLSAAVSLSGPGDSLALIAEVFLELIEALGEARLESKLFGREVLEAKPLGVVGAFRDWCIN